ncbi:hypothetical protein KHP62_01260 [Rhodobacteraceae bacterium NNCM2]|nr:hypothetical protein [Coraliihabitans acroporae]
MSVFNTGFGAPNASEGGGATDLSVQTTAGAVVVLSSTGADAVVPAATASKAGVLTAADKVKLDSLSGSLSLPDFETFAEAAAASPTGNFLRTAGYGSAGDGGGALYVRVTADPGHAGVLTTADGAFFELAEQRVTPAMFAAVGDGATDDGEALQAFFDYLETRPHIHGDFTGDWLTARTIRIRGGIGNRYTCGNIIGGAAMENLVEVIGQGLNFDGTLQLNGVASGSVSEFANRQIQNGLTLDGAGFSKFDKIRCQSFQRYGVRLETAGNNHINLGDVTGFDCGSPGESVPSATVALPFTARSDNTSIGFGQRSTLSTTGIPDYVKVSDIVTVGGRPLIVMEITGDDMVVYPRPPAGVTSGQIICLIGGVVSTFGNDAGLTWIDGITSLRCGSALRAGSLYGASIGKLHADFCGAAIVLGFSNLSSARRISIEGAYFESTEHHIIHTGSLSASVVIENPYDLDFDKVTRLIYHDNTDTPVQTELPGTTIVSDTIYTRTAQLGFGRTSSVMTLSNRPDANRLHSARNSYVVQLDYDESLDRLYGLNTVELFLFGSGDNNQPTGTITIEPTEEEIARGVTIDGGTGLNVPIGDHPVFVFLRYVAAEREWTVNLMEIAPRAQPSAAIAGPSGGGTVDSQSRAAINAILAALREQGLVAG